MNKKATHYTAKQLAELLGVHLETIRLWKRKGVGPEGIQAVPRGKILYPVEAVEAWQKRQMEKK